MLRRFMLLDQIECENNHRRYFAYSNIYIRVWTFSNARWAFLQNALRARVDAPDGVWRFPYLCEDAIKSPPLALCSAQIIFIFDRRWKCSTKQMCALCSIATKLFASYKTHTTRVATVNALCPAHLLQSLFVFDKLKMCVCRTSRIVIVDEAVRAVWCPT